MMQVFGYSWSTLLCMNIFRVTQNFVLNKFLLHPVYLFGKLYVSKDRKWGEKKGEEVFIGGL